MHMQPRVSIAELLEACTAKGKTFNWRKTFDAVLTCDGMLREDLYVGQVVVWTVFLQPSADILLGPQYNWPDEAGLSGAGVVDPIVVTGIRL